MVDFIFNFQNIHILWYYEKEYLENKGLYEERANLVKASSNFIMNVNQYLVDQLADYQIDSGDYMSASDHVDEMLYRGFTGPSDWKIIQQLSKIENAHDLDKELNSLEDKRLVELYKRKMYSDRNDLLTEETRKEHQDYIKDKISNIGEKLPWTTLAKARRELDKAITDSRFSGMEDQFKKIDNFLNNIEKKFL